LLGECRLILWEGEFGIPFSSDHWIIGSANIQL
jgi:hypothetical protein